MPGKTVPGSAAAGGGLGARLKQTRLGGGRRSPAGLAGPRLRRRVDGGAAGAGLEAGGGDVVLPVAQLEPEVAEAALEDGIGAVVEGREGRGVAALAKTDTVRGPQLPGQLLVRCSVVPGHRKIFSNFVNLNNKFIHCLFIVFTSILVWQHQCCAIQSLCWGDVGVLSWCGPETQEDPGQLSGPGGGGAMGVEGVLQAAE